MLLEKIINKIIMGTKCYIALKDKIYELENERTKFKDKFAQQAMDLIELNNIISKNKTTARKIVRAVNSLIKKDEIVNTQKQIKALCNEIIKV